MRVFRQTKCGKAKKDGHKHTPSCYAGPWYIDYFDNDGKRHREVGGLSKKDAERSLVKVREEIRQCKYTGKQGQKKLKDFCQIYLEYSKANKKSWGRDVTSLKRLIPYFGEKTLKAIQPYMIESYKAMRKKAVKDSTINRELACLKHMFSMAIKWGETSENPVKQVKFFKEHQKPMRILSYEEEELLLENANDCLKPVIITAVETGMRLGEIVGLKWSCVNLRERSLRVEDTKNGEFRVIPISSILMKYFEALDQKDEYLFLNSHGKRYISTRTAFENAVKRAGIPHIRFHDLRHTFGSRAVMSGVDLATVKELMGHKSISMTMRYSHPTPEHKRMAVEMLRKNIIGSKSGSNEIIREDYSDGYSATATIN